MMDFKTAKPRAVEAYLREVIRKTWGDAIENTATVYSRHGRYYINIQPEGKREFDFSGFRKTEAPQIAKAIRALNILHREPQ